MKPAFQYYILGSLVSLFSLPGVHPTSQRAHASDPLMDRTGSTLAVTINGEATKSIPKKKIYDSAKVEAYEAHWSASAPKGKLCFRLDPKDKRLGAPEKIDVMIHMINPEKPMQQWRSYETVPKPTEAIAAFSGGEGFCPAEYILTERLRYPELPPGEYVLRVAYWGVGNWDRQDVLFTVK